MASRKEETPNKTKIDLRRFIEMASRKEETPNKTKIDFGSFIGPFATPPPSVSRTPFSFKDLSSFGLSKTLPPKSAKLAKLKSKRGNNRPLVKYTYVDIVGYTTNSVQRQKKIIARLIEIVKQAVKKNRAQRKVRYIQVGDGIIVAIGQGLKVDIHLRIAIDILQLLKKKSGLPRDTKDTVEVRIGVNQNEDQEISDINKKRNYIGDGINVAARLMSAAEPNTIYVGQTVVEALGNDESYKGKFVKKAPIDRHGNSIASFEYVDKEYDLWKEYSFSNQDALTDWNIAGGKWEIRSGGGLHGKTGDREYIWLEEELPVDFQIEVEVTLDMNPEQWREFRINLCADPSKRNYYQLLLPGTTFVTFDKFVNGDCLQPAPRRINADLNDFPINQRFLLKVEKKTGCFTVWRDNKKILSHRDDEYKKGLLGFCACSGATISSVKICLVEGETEETPGKVRDLFRR